MRLPGHGGHRDVARGFHLRRSAGDRRARVGPRSRQGTARSAMRLDGIHHVTCITADAPRNVDFYTRVLALRLVKKTVNQDDPTVYHLFYADEEGHPGSDITFFEYPDAGPGSTGAGMVHTVVWRGASPAALEFWADRLGVEREGDTLAFGDPE